MTAPARRRYVVGLHKLAPADRDVARAVLAEHSGFLNMIGAEDVAVAGSPGATGEVGAEVSYSVLLSDAEADRFRGASNLRYLELDVEVTPGEVLAPRLRTLDALGAVWADQRPLFHGRDQTVAVLDSGTTQALRDAMGWVLVGRSNFGDVPANGAEIHPGETHGCGVASCAVPYGGRLLDVMVVSTTGSASAARFAAGARWAVDQGARILNFSYSTSDGGAPSSAHEDGIKYISSNGAVIFMTTGNNGENRINYPAAYSLTYSCVVSVGSYLDYSGRRSGFSNYTSDMTVSLPGEFIGGRGADGAVAVLNGTSYSAPYGARLVACLCTGGRVLPAVALDTLKTTRRTMPLMTAAEQGGGAFHLGDAVVSLFGLALSLNLCPSGGDAFDSSWAISGRASGRTALTASGYGEESPGVNTRQIMTGFLGTTAGYAYITTPAIAVGGNESWSFCAYYRLLGAAVSLGRVELIFYTTTNGSGAAIVGANVVLSDTADAANYTVRASAAVTTPGTAGSVRMRIRGYSSDGSGNVIAGGARAVRGTAPNLIYAPHRPFVRDPRLRVPSPPGAPSLFTVA